MRLKGTEANSENDSVLSKSMMKGIGMLMKKTLGVIAATGIVFALCALAGCSSQQAQSSSDSSAGAGADASDKPTLTVAMELAYPPFETKDDAGNAEGLSVDFMQDFADQYGYDLVIENTAWDGLIPSLQTDKADCVISSMTRS